MEKNTQNTSRLLNMSNTSIFVGLLMVILVIFIQLFLGKWLWNEVLVQLLPTTVRPINNLFQVLGLIVLFSILFSGLTTIGYGCYNGCVNYMN
jgi:hypothetical protein